ncbi:FMRFamide-related neuropeptides-like isoform X1 [Hylaeus volcanicus]|uniref:FMRFamide-related neuropeptides-like isoform X1 n=1 Tax=Hylaeus volcanicus TaxID=313075 RepID=UPI0023B8498A|nr:FMRFamide-related neuropeptides-like isoform X1 [Hylaeus volcanicus]
MFFFSLFSIILLIVSLCPSRGINPYSNPMNNYFLSDSSSASPFMPPSSNLPFMPQSSNSPFMPPSSNSPFMRSSLNSPFMPQSSNSPFMLPSSNSPFMRSSLNSPFMPQSTNSPFMLPSSNSPFMPPFSNSPFKPPSSNSPFMSPPSKHPFIHLSANSPIMQSSSSFPFVYEDTGVAEGLINSGIDKESKSIIPFPKAFWTFVKALVEDLNLNEPQILMRINKANHCIKIENDLHEGRKKHLQVMINIFCAMQSKNTGKKKRSSQRNKKNMNIDMFGPIGRSVSVIIKPTNAFYAEFKLTQMGKIVYSHLKRITSTTLSPCFYENS